MTQAKECSSQQGNAENSEDLKNLPTDEVDVLIIGAGPAG